MSAEYPSDDIEAFKHSGKKVFNIYDVEKMRNSCRPPLFIGEVRGKAEKGKEALQNLKFHETPQGELKMWEDVDKSINISNRYVISVDIGGRSASADYSVICVIDRYWLIFGEKAVVVAEWCGHIRHDLLAWKSVQIAKYYNNALLVIESNTIETKDNDTDGDHSQYILEEIAFEYDNLYFRNAPADNIIEGKPKKWGFHTNRATKTAIIDNLIRTVEEQAYVERDSATLDEFTTYEVKQNGSLGAIDGLHDDKLITRAIGLFVSNYKMDLPKEINLDELRYHRRNVGSASTL
ncbi:MAG: hypothetical protein IMY73_04600 [Bacteroidetes bacterium]|nr:hypothetical protein [Bacteroidota bacterium]